MLVLVICVLCMGLTLVRLTLLGLVVDLSPLLILHALHCAPHEK